MIATSHRENRVLTENTESVDIFAFWSLIKKGETIHPADRNVMNRINPENHGFELKCIPSPITGCLLTAPIVLLYLSPGLSDGDIQEATSEAGKEYYFKRWKGIEPLPTVGMTGYDWVKSRIKTFFNGQNKIKFDFEKIRQKIAILNIGAYHSKDVKNFASLLTLPSSRASLSWAQNTLFPQAEEGKRIVVCMRSANFWGLETGKIYGKSLFSPYVTRSGYLENNPLSNKIKKSVLTKLME